MSAAAIIMAVLWSLGFAVMALFLWTVFVWWPRFDREYPSERVKAENRKKPFCLDCVEYGAPYDGPCDFCGRTTPYVGRDQ